MKNKFILKTYIILALILGFSGLSLATTTSEFITVEDDEAVTWNLQADSMTSLEDGAIVEATGNILLEQGDNYIKADYARYFPASNWVFILGNVEAKLGKDIITASEAEFDLISKKGWLKNGYIFVEGSNIHFRGEKLNKFYGDRYSFDQATVTSCDGEVPAWSFSSESITMDIDGYAQLSDSSFKIANNTVMYTPYFIIPAKKTRQAGLLTPELAYTSLHGASVVIPWYYPFAEDYDLTFYLGMYEKTGIMPSVEFRSITSDIDKSWFAFNAMYQDRVVRNDGEDKIDPSDGLVRTNNLRFWFRGMANGKIGENDWKYKLNLDYVSDQNFLREFKDRLTGFDDTEEQLYKMFGRELAVIDSNRINELLVYREWKRYGLSVGLRYEESTNVGNGNLSYSYDESTQRLPEINAFLYKSYLFPNSPLEIETHFSSTYFHRNYGTSGLRTEIYPQISYPVKLGYATLIATGGLRLTDYSQVRSSFTSPIHPGTPSSKRQDGTYRLIPTLNFTAFSEGNRVYNIDKSLINPSYENVGKSELLAFRHTIQPRLEYNFIPKVNQNDNPFYDMYDRVLQTNEINFSVTNIISTKKKKILLEDATNPTKVAKPYAIHEYEDTLWLRLGMGYDFNEANRTEFTHLFPKRPFKDLTAEIEFNLLNNFSLSGKSHFSMYDFSFTRNDLAINYKVPSWLELSGGFSYRTKDYNYRNRIKYDNVDDIYFTKPLSLLLGEVRINLSDRWSIQISDYVNLRTGKTNEFSAYLDFTEQCYRFKLGYKYTPRETTYSVSVDLLGLFS